MRREKQPTKKYSSDVRREKGKRTTDNSVYELDFVKWYDLDKKGLRDISVMQERYNDIKNNKVNQQLEPGEQEIPDIKDKMGYFETKPAGTVSVGFNRYDFHTDLGFTVVSEKEKNREGIPERNPEDANTYFGGDWGGDNEPFNAGPISFRYKEKDDNIEKIGINTKGSSLKDEESLLYQDEEKEELEKIRKEKSENPDNVDCLSKVENQVEKIRDEKKKENMKFLLEIKDFIINLKRGKIKKLIESEEAAKRRRRILELSSKSEEDFWLLTCIKKMIEEMFESDVHDTVLAELFIMVKLKGLDIKDLEKIVENLKKEYCF